MNTERENGLTTELKVKDGVVMADSRSVAERFGRQHKDVLRAIRNLECSPEFTRRNFAPTVFIDKNGDEQPQYQMTRDGFSLLVMGFTGKAAMGWKEKYIGAFNAMEAQLRAQAKPLFPPMPAGPKADTLATHMMLVSAIAQRCGVADDRACAHLVDVAARKIDPALGEHRVLIPARTGDVAVNSGTMTPTEVAAAVNEALGKPMFVYQSGKPSPAAANVFMANMGWQEHRERAKGSKYWALLDAGEPYGEVVVAGHSGSSQEFIKWRPSAVRAIIKALKTADAFSW